MKFPGLRDTNCVIGFVKSSQNVKKMYPGFHESFCVFWLRKFKLKCKKMYPGFNDTIFVIWPEAPNTYYSVVYHRSISKSKLGIWIFGNFICNRFVVSIEFIRGVEVTLAIALQ